MFDVEVESRIERVAYLVSVSLYVKIHICLMNVAINGLFEAKSRIETYCEDSFVKNDLKKKSRG